MPPSETLKDVQPRNACCPSKRPSNIFPGENGVLLQAYEWNVPADQKHWQRLLGALESYKHVGITTVWIPPACKASGGATGNGYDIYDLYDLGEFDQKGSVSTKFGSKDELLKLKDKVKELGLGIYFDAVLNHKAGADHTERCRVVEVDNNGWLS